jgi:hypothetical protein
MADGAPRSGGAPPIGTQQRIRTRAIWAVALFAAATPPAIIGSGLGQASGEQANIALPLALSFGAIGLLFAIVAAIPTLRYWDHLPTLTRRLGALPLLAVPFLGLVALVTALA